MPNGSNQDQLHVPAETTREELGRLTTLAWPIVLGQVGLMTQHLVDTLMVGALGSEALAGVALGNVWSFAWMILGLGFAMGMDPLLTQHHGAGDIDSRRRVLRQGALLLTVASAPLALMHMFAAGGLSALGQPVAVLPVASGYANSLALAVWPTLIFTLTKHALQGRGLVQPAMWVALGANALNVVTNLVFIWGIGSWEGMGAVGVGYSTTLVRIVSMLALLAIAHEERQQMFRWSRSLLQPRQLGQIVTLAGPTSLQVGSEVWAFQSLAIMMGWLGAHAVAAHSIALNVTALTFMVPLGISAAAAVRVGNLIGAQQSWERAAHVAIASGAAVMSLSAVILASAPQAIVSCYLARDDPSFALAITLLPLAALFQIFDGVQVVTFGVLRGAGDTKIPMLANVLGYYMIGLPLGAWLILEQQAGPPGVWWGLILALVVVSAAVLARLQQLKRRGVHAVIGTAH